MVNHKIFQKTLKRSISFSGVGLHSGKNVGVCIKSAMPNTGIIFIRTDTKEKIEIKASYKNIKKSKLCTTLTDTQGITEIITVEHLLASLLGRGVDNAIIEIDGGEIPAFDGSSRVFDNYIMTAGLKELDVYRKFIKIKKRIEVEEGNKKMILEPFDGFKLDCFIDFEQPIGKQKLVLDGDCLSVYSEIFKARTFCRYSDVKTMQDQGFALGGSLSNALVIDKGKLMNKERMRYSDEFVRHKMLDILGDISLLGCHIEGSLMASCPGHEINKNLMFKIFNNHENYEILQDEIKDIWRDENDRADLAVAVS